LLGNLGCQIISLNCEPTGLFPRTPEPLPENLTELCKAVKSNKADLGIAVDPDSDRLALVSEHGIPLGEERTLALAVKFLLSKKSGPVVINASTSKATEDVAISAGSEVFRTKVGEINVAKKMREINSVIGGEGNGGVILPDIHLGRDAPVGVALILQYLAEFNGSISELNATLPQYYIVKDKVELTHLDPKSALSKLQDISANELLDFTDGIKILREKSWIHIRASNTEPIIRIIAEAPTEKEALDYCLEIKKQFQI
jgi:phosphomannomutase